MKYISTRNIKLKKTFSEAAYEGIAEDGGLYFPERIPQFDTRFWHNLKKLSFQDIALQVLTEFIDENETNLYAIVENSFNFPIEIKQLDDELFVLELFHGPSSAFKDFGARFLASVLSDYAKKKEKKLTVLVATSGDTGSAVGKAFYNAENIDVFLLFPSGKISDIQKIQLTTIGRNVTALEIDGTFDDCQRLVKTAFADDELRRELNLTSANSINIARLIPQALYYLEAYKIAKDGEEIMFSIPSGNLGNLTGALIAVKSGLPVKGIISALNINDVFAEYLRTGKFIPRKAKPTLSNAMDVGAPNNLERIDFMYDNNLKALKKMITATSINDIDTMKTVEYVFQRYNYVMCPHTAVAFFSLIKNAENFKNTKKVIAATANPAKFMNIYSEEIKRNIIIPKQLSVTLSQNGNAVRLSDKYPDFKEYLFSQK